MATEASDELGAHVSAEGGVDNAPARARAIGAASLQLFTKQPSRWADPKLQDDAVERFRSERGAQGVRFAVAHDSYLINLASPDRRLRAMSRRAFQAELVRSERLGLDGVVTHPGSATDGDRDSGLDRNADQIARVLTGTPGQVRVLLEITAGAGNLLGRSFAELGRMIERLPADVRDRVGVCVDTCHAFSAGYDWTGDYESVWTDYETHLDWSRLGLLHMNDSQHPLGSRRDRHAGIGEGSIGIEGFRRIMNDTRLAGVPKVLETPKGDDPVSADRANLATLRSLREERA